MSDVEAALTLIKAYMLYVSKRITSKREREAYLVGMNECLELAEASIEHGFKRLKYLVHVGNKFVWTKKFKRSLLSNPKRYYAMAFQHTAEIVDSIERRFV